MLLRGGFDGLAAVVPYGNPSYRSVRGGMAFEREALVPLADGFALAPGLAPLATLWNDDQLVALHALAIPYRTRSHFDAQAILETGLDQPKGSSDGWLNRLLQVMDGRAEGIAVAAGLPLSLSGPHPVATWSPSRLGAVEASYVERLHYLYRHDPQLRDRFEAALQLDAESGAGSMSGGRGPRQALGSIPGATARFLKDPDGPNVAAVELGGWDTHSNQGMQDGPLDRRFGQLAEALVGFRSQLGEAWSGTTVVVMTEFGRTAQPNGTGGTDHGTAGAGFVLGPELTKGRVVTDWPGLGSKELFEGRDLRPTLDTRAVLEGVLAGVFDLTPAQLARVFPGSEAIRPIYDIVRG
ncbi:MAG TPA: DUF1501 domain-containing protein [Thermoanaerobaculia bacterium]|nr:DUF1501 domain-containing protein [Thermoanaerobaculia bacterium]